jgi:hypothetical protein
LAMIDQVITISAIVLTQFIASSPVLNSYLMFTSFVSHVHLARAEGAYLALGLPGPTRPTIPPHLHHVQSIEYRLPLLENQQSQLNRR